jgi:hypothetical protein
MKSRFEKSKMVGTNYEFDYYVRPGAVQGEREHTSKIEIVGKA